MEICGPFLWLIVGGNESELSGISPMLSGIDFMFYVIELQFLEAQG